MKELLSLCEVNIWLKDVSDFCLFAACKLGFLPITNRRSTRQFFRIRLCLSASAVWGSAGFSLCIYVSNTSSPPDYINITWNEFIDFKLQIYRFKWFSTFFFSPFFSTLHMFGKPGPQALFCLNLGVQEMNLARRLLTPFAWGDHQQNGRFIALLRQFKKCVHSESASSLWLVRWLQLLYNNGWLEGVKIRLSMMNTH